MKSSNRDNAEGKAHQVKGKLKQAAGVITGNRDLESEGKAEKMGGKIQEKVGQFKKVIDR